MILSGTPTSYNNIKSGNGYATTPPPPTTTTTTKKLIGVSSMSFKKYPRKKSTTKLSEHHHGSLGSHLYLTPQHSYRNRQRSIRHQQNRPIRPWATEEKKKLQKDFERKEELLRRECARDKKDREEAQRDMQERNQLLDEMFLLIWLK